MKTLRIGTRKSELALWQANFVRERVLAQHIHAKVELVEIVSQGDRTLDIPLSRAGGKGLFLKELECAVLAGEIDMAVHSMKDVTVTLPEGLHIPVVLPREDPRDALVSNRYQSLEEMPAEAVVGTCSLRRQCQVRARYPHLGLRNLRGNVNTRLARLDSGQYDGIILAVAGLKRLGLSHRIQQVIDTEICLPAIGQGMIGIECRAGDSEVNGLIAPLNDPDASIQNQCERTLNARLGGGCHVPVGIFSELAGSRIRLRALVGEPDGSRIVYSEKSGPRTEPCRLGIEVAEDLISQGADRILESVYADAS
ncbi:MAG: hydroxymethylbilane synthase [Gammaproteobacteria bacterium]|nr:hydroxymethylbilane synthase [Gammaproteobacteria bacterium]